MTTTVYHLTANLAAWDQVCVTGFYQPNSLQVDGFIHASTVAQLAGSANRYFGDFASLIVFTIDLSRLQTNVQWEHSPHSPDPFPHIRGPIPRDAITQCRTWTRIVGQPFRWPIVE